MVNQSNEDVMPVEEIVVADNEALNEIEEKTTATTEKDDDNVDADIDSYDKWVELLGKRQRQSKKNRSKASPDRRKEKKGGGKKNRKKEVLQRTLQSLRNGRNNKDDVVTNTESTIETKEEIEVKSDNLQQSVEATQEFILDDFSHEVEDKCNTKLDFDCNHTLKVHEVTPNETPSESTFVSVHDEPYEDHKEESEMASMSVTETQGIAKIDLSDSYEKDMVECMNEAGMASIREFDAKDIMTLMYRFLSLHLKHTTLDATKEVSQVPQASRKTGIFIDLGTYTNGNGPDEQFKVSWHKLFNYINVNILNLPSSSQPDYVGVFYNQSSDKERNTAKYLRMSFGVDPIPSDLVKNNSDMLLSSELRRFVMRAFGYCPSYAVNMPIGMPSPFTTCTVVLVGGDSDYVADFKDIEQMYGSLCTFHVVSPSLKCSRYLINIAKRSGGLGWNADPFIERVKAYSSSDLYTEDEDDNNKTSEENGNDATVNVQDKYLNEVKSTLTQFCPDDTLYDKDVKKIVLAIQNVRKFRGLSIKKDIENNYDQEVLNDRQEPVDTMYLKKQLLENILHCWADGKIPSFRKTIEICSYNMDQNPQIMTILLNDLIVDGYITKYKINVIGLPKDSDGINGLIPEPGVFDLLS